MEIWQAIILGAVQGFAEFLPISSSGHLILIQRWFGITDGAVFYSIMFHIGTLIPVFVVLWKEIISLFKPPFTKMFHLALASIPAGAVGLALHFVVDLDNIFADKLYLLAITFLITAVILIFSELRVKKVQMINPINYSTAFIMGCGQAVGVVSGLSRSGATACAGCIGRVKPEQNASFTFLMSLPVVIAAVLLEGYCGFKEGFGSFAVVPMIFGILTATITGYIAISVMMKLIKRANYKWFSLYLVAISIATLITYFVA